MVDSNDRERIGEAREELMRMLAEDELRDAVLLIFANKQVCPFDLFIHFIALVHVLALSRNHFDRNGGMLSFINSQTDFAVALVRLIDRFID